MTVSRSQPVLADRGQPEAEPSAAHIPVAVVLELQDQMDERGRPRSFFLKETWGSTVAEGVPVEFYRSINGMHVEIDFSVDGRRHSYRVSLQPALQASIAAAIAKATGRA